LKITPESATKPAGDGCKFPPAIVLPPWRLSSGQTGGYKGRARVCDRECMLEREKGWPACTKGTPETNKPPSVWTKAPAEEEAKDIHGQVCKWKGLGNFVNLNGPKPSTWPWWRYTRKAAPEDHKSSVSFYETRKFSGFLVDKKLNHGDACAVHGGCNSYNASGTVCRDAGCTCELRWATPDYTPALQPTGFLSRLGAEGSDKEDAAHQVVMWFGTAGSEWKNTDMIKLQLSTRPRYRNNLAKASYPYTSLVAHKQQVFSLQISDSSSGAHPSLDLEELQVNLDKKLIVRKFHARIKWPKLVKRGTDFLCNPDFDEEKTLKTASPMILHNPVYNARSLLLNVKNLVYMYNLGSTATNLSSYGVATALTGLAHYDPKDASSTTQVAINQEKLYVVGSSQIWTSVDVSLSIPCGQLMGTLRRPLQLWQVGVAASETAPLLVNSSVPGTSAGLWNCTASKAVSDIAPGARMKKYTVCCANGESSACCVESETEAGATLNATELAQKVAGNA